MNSPNANQNTESSRTTTHVDPLLRMHMMETMGDVSVTALPVRAIGAVAEQVCRIPVLSNACKTVGDITNKAVNFVVDNTPLSKLKTLPEKWEKEHAIPREMTEIALNDAVASAVFAGCSILTKQNSYRIDIFDDPLKPATAEIRNVALKNEMSAGQIDFYTSRLSSGDLQIHVDLLKAWPIKKPNVPLVGEGTSTSGIIYDALRVLNEEAIAKGAHEFLLRFEAGNSRLRDIISTKFQALPAEHSGMHGVYGPIIFDVFRVPVQNNTRTSSSTFGITGGTFASAMISSSKNSQNILPDTSKSKQPSKITQQSSLYLSSNTKAHTTSSPSPKISTMPLYVAPIIHPLTIRLPEKPRIDMGVQTQIVKQCTGVFPIENSDYYKGFDGRHYFVAPDTKEHIVVTGPIPASVVASAESRVLERWAHVTKENRWYINTNGMLTQYTEDGKQHFHFCPASSVPSEVLARIPKA